MSSRYKLIKNYILIVAKPKDIIVFNNNYNTKFKYLSAKNWFCNFKNLPGIIISEQFIYSEKIIYPRSLGSIKIISKKSE